IHNVIYAKIYISYESTRFTQISDRTAVVTSEYNMMSVREWLARHTEIETCKTA
ncbi:DUF6956 domain-containing protein, partial [Alistipes putredinis]|uniref:DUF6956 domain-containing protein n=1 Tax=Alistipes putredinis TaxID=28117 RepID=UPI003C6C6F3F